MAKKTEDEHYNSYVIPMNFENGARLFGFIKFWNALETIVICGGLGFIEYYIMSFLKVELTIFVGIMCATIIPIGIFCIIGIEGCDLVRFLLRMLRSIQNRKHIVRKENYNAVLKEKNNSK